MLVVEEVPLGKSAYGNTKFWAWSIKRVKRGDSDEDDIVKRDGSKAKPFNFSGRLATLPELHKAMKTLQMSRREGKFLSPKAALSLRPDKHGIVDVAKEMEEMYTNKYASFSEFRSFVRWAAYKNISNQFSSYLALTITKRKSERALKSARSSATPYFTLQIPVRCLDALIVCIEIHMERNGMKPLNLGGKI